MRERKSLRSQVDSHSFTLTENGHALYRSDITCVCSKMIFSPEFNFALSVGMHQQKRLGYVRNPRSLMEGTETLCRDDIGDLPGSPNHL